MDIRKRRPHIDLVAIDHAAAVANAKLGLCEEPPPLDSRVVRVLEGERPSQVGPNIPVFAQRSTEHPEGEKAPVIPDAGTATEKGSDGDQTGQPTSTPTEPVATVIPQNPDGGKPTVPEIGGDAITDEEETVTEAVKADEKGSDGDQTGKPDKQRKRNTGK